jgi:uncharacterized protein RhaS with RHS repeats
MKFTTTKKLLTLGVVLVALAGAHSASAFYNPGTGQWLSRDPIGERGGQNLNRYVRNNPVSFADPLGLEAVFLFVSGETIVAQTPTEFAKVGGDAKEESIVEIHLYGHAGSGAQSFNRVLAGEPGLEYRKGSVFVVDRDNNRKPKVIGELGELLKGKFAKRARIYLHGCNVAANDDNITKAISKAVPNVSVIGSTGDTYNITKGFVPTFAVERIYKNGKLY